MRENNEGVIVEKHRVKQAVMHKDIVYELMSFAFILFLKILAFPSFFTRSEFFTSFVLPSAYILTSTLLYSLFNQISQHIYSIIYFFVIFSLDDRCNNVLISMLHYCLFYSRVSKFLKLLEVFVDARKKEI